MGEQADAVAELEHQVGTGQDVGVAAAHLGDDDAFLPRQLEVADRPADDARLGGEDAQVVEVAPVLEHLPGRRVAEALAGLLEHLLGRADDQDDVVLGDDVAVRGRLVLVAGAQGDDLRLRRQAAHDLAHGLAEEARVAQRDLQHLHPGAARRLDLRLQDHEGEVEEQDRAGDAERVGHRVADGRVVVAERGDRRLQRRRAGAGAGEQAQRIADVEPRRLGDEQADDARREHADQRDQVGPAPRRARQADEELLAVLHADGVEEEGEAEGADHPGRGGLRREPADGEGDEQHRADAEREALDVDLADEVADGDRQEQRHQWLLFEKCPEVVHCWLSPKVLFADSDVDRSLVHGQPPASELAAHPLGELGARRARPLRAGSRCRAGPTCRCRADGSAGSRPARPSSARRRSRPPSGRCRSRR